MAEPPPPKVSIAGEPLQRFKRLAMPDAEEVIARKPLQRFERLTASLETLISSIAEDWKAAAKPPAANEVLVDDGPTKPIHGKIRKAQLLFSELHSTTRKAHGAIETIRYVVIAICGRAGLLTFIQGQPRPPVVGSGVLVPQVPWI